MQIRNKWISIVEIMHINCIISLRFNKFISKRRIRCIILFNRDEKVDLCSIFNNWPKIRSLFDLLVHF